MKFLLQLLVLGMLMAAGAAEIAVPVRWERASAPRPLTLRQIGAYRDSDKYVFAFHIAELSKLLADRSGTILIYWNSDGNAETGRFPGELGVDVQFNIQTFNRSIKAVLWTNVDSERRFMTLYEDDVLLEPAGDVLYFALRAEALRQFKIAGESVLRINIADSSGRRDSVEIPIDFGSKTAKAVAPALQFIRFGSARAHAEKSHDAAPVTRPGAKTTVWNCFGERFQPAEPPPAFGPAVPALELKAARGETASVFFAAESSRPVSNWTLLPGELTGTGNRRIPASAQRLQYADFVADDRGDRFTDVLLPQSPAGAARRQFAVLSCSVPRDAAPGVYRGEMKITVDGKEDIPIPVTLEVYDFELPEISAFPTAFSIKSSHVSARFRDPAIASELYRKLLDQCVRFRYGPRLIGVDPKLSVDSDGILRIDWTNFDKILRRYFDEYKFNVAQIVPAQLGSHDKFFRWNSLLKRNYKDTADPEFASLWKQFVRQYTEHVKSLGVQDKMLFIIWDEPYASVDDIERAAKTVRENAPDQPIGLFIDRHEPRLEKLIDIWLVTFQTLAPLRTKAEYKNKRVWLYNSGGVDNFRLPASDLRGYYWMADHYKVEGFLSSEINVIARSGRTEKGFFNHYPQHCLMYASEDGKELYDSWRQVLIRDGINDYDYLALYRRLLNERGETVPAWLTDAMPKFEALGNLKFKVGSMRELDALRDRIARDIVRLRHTTPRRK